MSLCTRCGVNPLADHHEAFTRGFCQTCHVKPRGFCPECGCTSTLLGDTWTCDDADCAYTWRVLVENSAPLELYGRVRQLLAYVEATANEPGALWCTWCGNPVSIHEGDCRQVVHPRDQHPIVFMGKPYRWVTRNGRYALIAAE